MGEPTNTVRTARGIVRWGLALSAACYQVHISHFGPKDE